MSRTARHCRAAAGALVAAQDHGRIHATGYPIVVFSTDPRGWSSVSRRVAVVRPSTDGTFRVAGLPAGAYYVGAVVDLDPGDLDDPGFFEALTRAALMVTLTDGVKTVRDLRLASNR